MLALFCQHLLSGRSADLEVLIFMILLKSHFSKTFLRNDESTLSFLFFYSLSIPTMTQLQYNMHMQPADLDLNWLSSVLFLPFSLPFLFFSAHRGSGRRRRRRRFQVPMGRVSERRQ